MGTWSTLAMRLATEHGPQLLREVRRAITTTSAPPGGNATPSAPVRTHPTGDRAMRIDYCPRLDGRADPGEIVWAWVTYEEDAHQGKDRPLLVVGRSGDRLLALMLSSQAYHRDDPDWQPLGSGDWDGEHRDSFVRLDRVLEVAADGIRREGAILDRERFDQVATALRQRYGWT